MSAYFTDFLSETGRKEQVEFEKLSAEDLAPLLKEFYYGVRSKKNERYSRSAFKSICAGLQRHLDGKPYFRKFSLSKDNVFKEANHVYDGYLAKLKKDGLDKTAHKKTILPGDVARLYKYVFTDSPQGLLYRVFFEIILHFGRRGRENLRRLTPGFLKLETDDRGRKFYSQNYNGLDKNHREDDEDINRDAIISAVPGDPDCPVKHITKYLKLLNKKCTALFQHPTKKIKDPKCWYDNSPVGKNVLEAMMKKMSEVGNLSQTYTNHCIRKTCVTTLDMEEVNQCACVLLST